MEPDFVQDTRDEIEDLSTLYKIVTRSMLIRAISEAGGVSLVWFGLVGFSFNASLEPQPRARRRARLAEDAPARNAFWTGRARPNPGTACAA